MKILLILSFAAIFYTALLARDKKYINRCKERYKLEELIKEKKSRRNRKRIYKPKKSIKRKKKRRKTKKRRR